VNIYIHSQSFSVTVTVTKVNTTIYRWAQARTGVEVDSRALFLYILYYAKPSEIIADRNNVTVTCYGPETYR
jgi:hypothetical protein